MNKIDINLPDGRTSQIYIGECMANVGQYTDNRKAIIITEKAIFDLYSTQFPNNAPIIFINSGELNKSLASIAKITEQLIELGADRECYIVGIGGGIVCDITGFIASIFMRGVRFGFVSTTLLAQVDASVGGKNGVNFNKYKNMLGVFNQPNFVLCDTSALKTLPPRELYAGLAEVVKTALIADEKLFDYLEKNSEKVLALDDESINYIVKRCVEIKASVVEADEREAGERRKLNLGHTFGHAIEKNSNLLHGEAVSIGIAIAAQISQSMNLLTLNEVKRIETLLVKFNLPIKTDIDKLLLIDALTKDKKKHNKSIHFVLNNGIGKAKVQLLTFDELNRFF